VLALQIAGERARRARWRMVGNIQAMWLHQKPRLGLLLVIHHPYAENLCDVRSGARSRSIDRAWL